jgi:hypothetical protein
LLDSNAKGAIAEQEIMLAATGLGVPVLKPVAEHGRCDLALDVGGRIWRVQCKWGRLGPDGDVVIVNIRTSRFSPRGYVQGTYREDEFDLLGVYCGELDRCFLLPSTLVAGVGLIHLRLTAARNNQQACITLASDFDFEGAVAQLGRAPAWHAGGQGFESPQLHSPGTAPIVIGSNPFRDRFGYWMDRVAAGETLLVTRRGKPRIRLSPATTPLVRIPRTAP